MRGTKRGPSQNNADKSYRLVPSEDDDDTDLPIRQSSFPRLPSKDVSHRRPFYFDHHGINLRLSIEDDNGDYNCCGIGPSNTNNHNNIGNRPQVITCT